MRTVATNAASMAASELFLGRFVTCHVPQGVAAIGAGANFQPHAVFLSWELTAAASKAAGSCRRDQNCQLQSAKVMERKKHSRLPQSDREEGLPLFDSASAASLVARWPVCGAV